MLPDQHRLKKTTDIELVKKNGKLFTSENLKLLVLNRQSSNMSETRFAFIVSSRVSKKAVDRNKLTRLLREVIKENLNSLVNGYDCLFIVKTGAQDAHDLKQEANTILRKANLVN